MYSIDVHPNHQHDNTNSVPQFQHAPYESLKRIAWLNAHYSYSMRTCEVFKHGMTASHPAHSCSCVMLALATCARPVSFLGTTRIMEWSDSWMETDPTFRVSSRALNLTSAARRAWWRTPTAHDWQKKCRHGRSFDSVNDSG